MNWRGFLSLCLSVMLMGFAATAAQAQTLGPWQTICWQNVSSYSVVRVHFQPTNNRSDWDSNLTVNGLTIGSVGNNSSYAGYRDVPGSGISLGWVRVGSSGWLVAPYNASINYGSCNPVFEDTGISPTEGYFWFEGANYVQPTLSVSKSASSQILVAGASAQSYTIAVTVADGPSTQAITISDTLPSGITTSGTITASGGGSVAGCPGAGASSLSGCYIPQGANGTVYLNVPISIADSAVSHGSYTVTNTAYAAGGGASNCTGSACAGSTSNTVINALNDSATQPAGVQSSTDVSANDAYPAGSSFKATGGTCSSPSPFSPSSNTTGVLGYTLPAGSTSCTVTYQLCAPAPYSTVCDSATLTVTASAPTITLRKQLGGTGRINAADQFTVQIRKDNLVVNNTGNSTTQGSGSSVTAGSGTTNSFAATADASYTLHEVMAAGSSSTLGRYSSQLSCSNATGTTLPSGLGQAFTIRAGDAIECTVTNRPAVATLTLRQIVLAPVPVSLLPPYSLSYTGTNGWSERTLTNTSLDSFTSSATQTLTALNTATQLSTSLPEPRWFVSSFNCVDLNAAATGNTPGSLVRVTDTSITLPADVVRAGSALRCTMSLGHYTP